ncbi:unnamed protein product, partial [Medioppia subpectinata]
MREPLDQSIGLSYALIADGKAYIITNDEYNQKTVPNKPIPIPPEFQTINGILLFDNRSCDPNDYRLMAYNVTQNAQNQIWEWHTFLNLINWTPNTVWTTPPIIYLPEYLSNDPYMNHYPFTFTMFWHKRRTLFLIQMPVSGAPVQPNTYHAIIGPQTCTKKYRYNHDRNFKITQVLKPYEDFDSCFIENDTQIICFGPKGFSTYDIDLIQTNNGQIRVENHTKTPPNIPLVDIIQQICSVSTTASINTTPVNISIPIAITTELSQTTEETASVAADPTEDDGSPLFWTILAIILALIVVFLFAFLLCSLLRKSKDKNDERSEDEFSKSGSKSGVDNKSSLSMRSQFNDQNKRNALNESTIDSQSPIRSQTN